MVLSARKLQTAVLDDTGVELGLELLADVVREDWLVANGSPYPDKDSIPAKHSPKTFRYLCYRWISYWVLEQSRIDGEGQTQGRLDLTQSTRPLLREAWPDAPAP